MKNIIYKRNSKTLLEIHNLRNKIYTERGRKNVKKIALDIRGKSEKMENRETYKTMGTLKYRLNI